MRSIRALPLESICCLRRAWLSLACDYSYCLSSLILFSVAFMSIPYLLWPSSSFFSSYWLLIFLTLCLLTPSSSNLVFLSISSPFNWSAYLLAFFSSLRSWRIYLAVLSSASYTALSLTFLTFSTLSFSRSSNFCVFLTMPFDSLLKKFSIVFCVSML